MSKHIIIVPVQDPCLEFCYYLVEQTVPAILSYCSSFIFSGHSPVFIIMARSSLHHGVIRVPCRCSKIAKADIIKQTRKSGIIKKLLHICYIELYNKITVKQANL